MALPRDGGGSPKLRRHSSFPVPKPEIQRSAPPKRRAPIGPPAPRRPSKPVGVFKPFRPAQEAPSHRIRRAQQQASHRTRRAAARIPQAAPTIPVIAPANQPRGYQQAVRKLAGPLAQGVHNRAMADQRRGRSYRQSVSEQLDALGPQARKLFRAYLQTVAGPNAQKRADARALSLFQQSGGKLNPYNVELGGIRGYTMPTVRPTGGDDDWIARVQGRSIRGGQREDRSALSTLADVGGSSFGLLPKLLSGAVAKRADQSGATNLAAALRLFGVGPEITRTYLEHPDTLKRDAAFARDFLLGTASVPYALMQDTLTGYPLNQKGVLRAAPGAIEAAPALLAEDYKRRYSPALEGNWSRFRGTVRQTGATPYVFDAASLVSGVGKGAGLLARQGALGRRLEEFASTPRALMRIAPGELRRQRDESRKVAPNLFRMGAQRRRDNRRRSWAARQEAKADRLEREQRALGNEAPTVRRFIQSQERERAVPAGRAALQRVVDQAGGKIKADDRGMVHSVSFTAERAAGASPAHFERVTKRLEQLGFERRRVGGSLVFYAPKEVTRRSRFLENRAVRSIPAHLKGVAVNEIRALSAEEAHAFQQAAGPSARLLRIKGLSKHERAALFLVGTGRLPADNPAKAIERLDAIKARILAEREAAGAKGAGARTRFATEVLKRIDYLRANADKAFTPNLRKAVLTIGQQVRRGERENPFLVPTQRVAARYGPGALELGVERGTRTADVFDARATEKSIARHEERVARRRAPERGARARRREFVVGEGAVRERDRQLRNEQTRVNEALNRNREQMRPLVERAQEYERRGRAGEPGFAARAANLRSGPIGRLVDEGKELWMRGQAIAKERDALDTQLQAIARAGKVSGRPEADAASIEWFHGTPLRFEGPPTAEGKRSDLGVYLTSDPGYALHGYAGGPDAVRRGEGRVMSMRVQPRKVLDMRFGKGLDPDTFIYIGNRLLERHERVIHLVKKQRAEEYFRRIIRDVEQTIGPTLTMRRRGEGPMAGIRPEIREKLGLLESRFGDFPITKDPRARNLLAQIRRQANKEAEAWAQRERESGFARTIREVTEALRTNTEFRMAAQTGENKLAEVMMGSARIEGPTTYLRAWKEFDLGLRALASEITSMEVRLGRREMRTGVQEGTGPLREILTDELGYDSIRKVDVYADALVVLDEKLLGRRSKTQEQAAWLLNGAKRDRGETTAEWVKRVRKAMDENGIDHPPFFAPSEELRTPKFTNHTAGGSKSPEPPKKREYVLQRFGRERTDPEIIYEGIQRNHRTRLTAQLVADVFDRVSHHRYRNLKTHDLKVLAENEGFDPSLYAVWYPKLYRDTLRNRLVSEVQGAAKGFGRAASQLEQEAAATQGAFGHLRDLLTPGSDHAAIVSADNIEDLHALLDNPRFKGERGTLVPRAAFDELHSSMKETVGGRLMERLKTIQSRAVLGGLNLNWLQADAIVNTLVATVIGGASPAAFIQQHAFFKNLPPDVKRWVHDELDIGVSRSNVHIPHLGATVNNRFVNYFRFLRESPWGQRVRPVQRSINAFLSFERTLGNNPQRRALAYHLLRKEAFRQLDEDVGHLNGVLHRVSSVFTGGSFTPDDVKKQMLAIVRNKREFEEIGRRTAEILGDWTTFTALERKTVGRYFFFYPYLRYSMKLAFYTLPLDHPVRLGIIANLANLNMDEQRRLVGADEADTHLLAGRYFYRDSEGRIHEYNVRTFNPVGNVVTEAQESSDLLQLMPPAFTILLGQFQKRDIYRGRDWRVKGTANREALRDIGPLDGMLGSERYRIFAREILDLPPLTRMIAKYMLPGEQGDDSLPFSPRPTKFKDEQRQIQANKKRERETTSIAERFLQDQFRAFTPKESDILDVLQRRHARKPGGAGSSTGPSTGWGAPSTPGAATGGSGWGG